MPDFVSRKKLKKKVLDRWENEGGNLSADGKNLPENNLTSNRGKKRLPPAGKIAGKPRRP